MLFFKKNKQAAIILAVIAIGLILAILILNTEQHQADGGSIPPSSTIFISNRV